jgi:phosphate:Na+ symporter
VQIDYFKDVLVPVVGGLGIFMLGLEYMSDGIRNLTVTKLRETLARVAGTPSKGLVAGTLITGVLQSSTAMTVMVVGLVNSGVLGLRPAISVIMGANIGTTLGNGLIALPLGPIGLLLSGFFALVYVFAKGERLRSIMLACLGFSLIFFGLNLMTGGLKPLRDIPQVMSLIFGLRADSLGGVVSCVLSAALITAMIHSSSATIGIVMGLGAAGILSWQTAIAFSLGADLGTTITSWIASLNLSRNAKRAAYAHIAFNLIGVAVMVPLFMPSLHLLEWAMSLFGADPARAVVTDGKTTFPLVPAAVGIYSIAFNVFNTALLFPFIGVFEHVLSRIGHTLSEDIEDYSVPRFLSQSKSGRLATGVPVVQQEMRRYLEGASLLLAIARGDKTAPSDPLPHHQALDILSRDIRAYTAGMFNPERTAREADMLASLIEEKDFTASLGETLFQVARRTKRVTFSATARPLMESILGEIELAIRKVLLDANREGPIAASDREERERFLLTTRSRCLELKTAIAAPERLATLELLGSAERAFLLVDRIDAERRSIPRVFEVASPTTERRVKPGQPAPVPVAAAAAAAAHRGQA